MGIDEEIGELLSHSEASERRNAAERLAENEMNLTIIETLAGGLKDIDRGVRDICARALLRVPEEFGSDLAAYIAPMIGESNIELRNLAAEILKHTGVVSIKSVLPFARNTDVDVRQLAIEVIGGIGSGVSADDIIEFLRDENSNVRNAAIEALGNLRVSESTELLIQMYGEDIELRPMIIESLGKIGGTLAGEFLLDLLKTEEDQLLKLECVDALAFIGEDIEICYTLMQELPETMPELQGILLKTIYAIAFRLEMEMNLPEDLRYIAHNAIFDDDLDLRSAGLLALGNKYYPDDIKALVCEVHRNFPDTQQMVVTNLLLNSETDVIEGFFREYASGDIKNMEPVEFLSLLPFIWDSIPEDNKREVVRVNTKIVFDKKNGYPVDILEILFNLDIETIKQTMLELIPDADMMRLGVMIESIRRFARFEFVPVLDALAKVGDEINSRAKELLEEISG